MRISARSIAAPPSTPATTASSPSIAGLLAGRDDHGSGHLLVPAPAEDVAMEEERARLFRDEAYPRRLAWFDVDAQAEIRNRESVVPIERGQFEDHRHALLHFDGVGRVG